MSEEITFPVAETFYSIQGEGLYAGTPMFFIRLAGCNVGKATSNPDLKVANNPKAGVLVSPFQIQKPEHTTCTSYSGTQFVCDTDYRVKERLTIQDLDMRCGLSNPRIEHVSITGGEPLIHKHLKELVQHFISGGTMVHLETSGTLSLLNLRVKNSRRDLWITCSPKQGFLQDNRCCIDQYKFLVENDEDVKWVEEIQTKTPIFIQPIEHYDANGPIKSSYDFVVDVVKKHPTWRLSIQMHKILGVR